MTIALVDADIVAYRNAAASENDGLEIALVRVDRMMQNILDATKAGSYKSFLSGDTNFRNEINPEYKANRRNIVRPQYLNDCKEYLVTEWHSRVTDGYEADDALGFNQTDESIICTIDKDLMMVPGKHYNFIKEEFTDVSELDGLKAFYRQCLIGDTSDNIIGVSGIGPVKAAKIINSLETEEEMFATVSNLYDLTDTDTLTAWSRAAERFWMNVDCLWIQRVENERFSDRYANK